MKNLLAVGLVVCLLAAVPLQAQAQNQGQIDNAVKGGVQYLLKQQKASGVWPYFGAIFGPTGSQSDCDIGVTALIALTLMECDPDSKDAAIQRAVENAAKVVRSALPSLNHTYSLSTSLWFMDKLKDSKSVQLIAKRLMSGQNNQGGWTYFCGGGLGPRPGGLAPPGLAGGGMGQNAGDNSNTQFAVLALWIARSHGMEKEVEPALRRTAARFRKTQNMKSDGGWGYLPPQDANQAQFTPSTPSMTCAGLLGLAIEHGLRPVKKTTTVTRKKDADSKDDKGAKEKFELDELNEDKAIQAAMALLAYYIGGENTGGHRISDLYFLWSMERVAVVYNRTLIGGKDWYGIGSELILRSQQQDGSWTDEKHPGPHNTCFALLFLRRVNILTELTAQLRGETTVTTRKDGKPADKAAAAAGKDAKDSAANPALPVNPDPAPAAASSEAAKLAKELLTAKGARQSEIIELLQETKGGDYTQALLDSIPKLSGQAQDQVRDALARRLKRMSSNQLRTYLKDDSADLRRAAAQACGLKGDKDLMADLKPLMNDSDMTVSAAAREAVKKLGG